MRQQLEEMGDARGRDDPDRDGGVRASATSSCACSCPTMDDPVDRLNRATHLEALKLADDPRASTGGCT